MDISSNDQTIGEINSSQGESVRRGEQSTEGKVGCEHLSKKRKRSQTPQRDSRNT